VKLKERRFKSKAAGVAAIQETDDQPLPDGSTESDAEEDSAEDKT
jgi:hypothetical protein